MDLTANDILVIQKFIFLLDDFHYREFREHLKNINAVLPLKLTEEVRSRLPEFDSHEVLCKKIYGSFDKPKKQSFNQLSSYTFKLSYNLAQNYPGYLCHNISRIQRLVNEQQPTEAGFLAEILLDVTERIDEFDCRIFTLQFLCEQAFLINDTIRGLKLNEQLDEMVAKKSLLIKLLSQYRKTQDEHVGVIGTTGLENLKSYFAKFHTDAHPSIRILSRYAYLKVIYEFDPKMFTDADVGIIDALEKDLQVNAFVVLPFLNDIQGSLGFLKLNSSYTNPGSKDSQKHIEELSRHYDSVKFWGSYLNRGQIYLVTVSATRLLSIYHCHIHRSDYYLILRAEDRTVIEQLLKKCEELLLQFSKSKSAGFGIRSIKMLYGALLIISGGDNIKKGIYELEALLVAYQQVNLKSSTDSIFMCLMIGYFSLKDYNKCALTFKRYAKNIKGKQIFEQNDVKIYAYYYISQWLLTRSKQYHVKLEGLLKPKKPGAEVPQTIMELINYFKVPVSLNRFDKITEGP
jgi:hypothetical protein